MMRHVTILILFSLPSSLLLQEGCKVSLFGFSSTMVFSAATLDVIYPLLENTPGDRNLTIPPGETVIFSCKGGRFEGYTTKTIPATCNRNLQFEVQDAILDVDALYCSNFNPVVAKMTTTSCAPNSVLIEVGFEIGVNIKFVPQVVVCFDVVKLSPVYTNHNLTKAIGFIKSYLTTSYVTDSVYNVTIDFDTLYSDVSYQQKTVNELLGLPVNSTKYVDPVSCSPYPPATVPGFCFSKRPLTYRGDLVYVPQHYATYRYINVAVQWSFLDYNLDKLERNVIDYVKAKLLDLEVYTGCYGVLTLPHEDTGEAVEVYLHSSGKVAVPLIFWKLLYHRANERATVFFTINNPHLTENEVGKYVLCNDVSDQITWLTWEKHNSTKGYSYACSYDDARANITYLPEIQVQDLLL